MIGVENRRKPEYRSNVGVVPTRLHCSINATACSDGHPLERSRRRSSVAVRRSGIAANTMREVFEVFVFRRVQSTESVLKLPFTMTHRYSPAATSAPMRRLNGVLCGIDAIRSKLFCTADAHTRSRRAFSGSSRSMAVSVIRLQPPARNRCSPSQRLYDRVMQRDRYYLGKELKVFIRR